MADSVAATDIYTDFSGFESLKARARSHDDGALQEVAHKFEAIFLKMLMKDMRSASLGKGIFDSDAGKFYNEMLDQQLSVELVKNHSIGLADMLVRQLSKGAVDSGQKPSAVMSGSDTPAVERHSLAEKSPLFKTPGQFVKALYPEARQAAARIGVAPEVLLAQSALETGWGGAVMSENGVSSHNLFGIKADTRWDGARVFGRTIEYRDNIAAAKIEPFRSYDSLRESFDDYAGFILSQPRYHKAVNNAEDSAVYVNELQRAGYATDPDYASKILKIMNNPVFRESLRRAQGLA